jgi:hypothetical protein
MLRRFALGGKYLRHASFAHRSRPEGDDGYEQRAGLARSSILLGFLDSALILLRPLQHLYDFLRREHRIDPMDHAVVGPDAGLDHGRLAQNVGRALDPRPLVGLLLLARKLRLRRRCQAEGQRQPPSPSGDFLYSGHTFHRDQSADG